MGQRQINWEIDLGMEDGTQTGMVKYGDKLAEDQIRKYVMLVYPKKKLVYQSNHRENFGVTVTITARPGIIIGKDWTRGEQVKEELKKVTDKRFKLTSLKLKDRLDAYLVTTSICRQINRISYRRAIKMATVLLLLCVWC
jgi:ribosomal protein S3